jgi:hypothetical protein
VGRVEVRVHLATGPTSKPVNRRSAGAIYWRAAGLHGNEMRTVMSRQSYVRELTAAEARQVNAQLASFDNNISFVEESASPEPAKPAPEPFTFEPDWAADPAICSPPAK